MPRKVTVGVFMGTGAPEGPVAGCADASLDIWADERETGTESPGGESDFGRKRFRVKSIHKGPRTVGAASLYLRQHYVLLIVSGPPPSSSHVVVRRWA